MSKNKKIILASIGILAALIGSVLLIRKPVEVAVVTEPTNQVEQSNVPDIPPPKDLDKTHEKIVSLVNDVGVEIGKQAPTLWQRIVDAWLWFEVFPARYAVILIVVAVLIIGLITGGKNKRSQQGR